MATRYSTWTTLFGVTALLGTCQAPTVATTRADPAAVPAPAPAPPAQLRRFDPDVVRATPDSPTGRLRAALAESTPRALEQLDSLAVEAGSDGARLLWLGARAAERAGSTERARALFGRIAGTEHPLAPWARLERARLLADSDLAAAERELAPLITLDWAGQRAARELHASTLLRGERRDEAEPLLRALLAEAADSARPSVAMSLAELLAARDGFEAKREAIGLWRRVTMRAPLSRSAREAEARIEQALASLSPREREQVGAVRSEDALARAEALAAAMQHTEAEAAFTEVARTADDPALRCRARLGAGRAIYNQRGERRRAADVLARVGDDCEEPDVRAWARFLAGKGFASASDHGRALEQYDALEEELPTHRLADDARFRAALIDAARSDFRAMTERLRTLPERYPNGDMHAEAHFLLAWRARRAGQLDEALSQLEASVRDGTGEDAEDVRGRAAYWRGRLLAELGRGDEAERVWTELVGALPLSYYAQQALARLGERGREAADRARAAMGERGDGRITFPWRAEMESPAFERAVELFAVGELDDARDELEQLGERDEELRWVEAALLDRVGAHTAAIGLTRRTLSGFREHAPTGEHFARWRIAYPRAYASLIEEAATSQRVPPEFVRAIAREESSFQADAVSTAHAYGLVQILVGTARRFGRPLGLEATPITLRDPRTNVTLGSAFMGWLWARYPANPAVVPSAYNAGQGATDRWLAERPQQQLDEWVEDIPYDETRRYTRRVLQSWGVYSWLDRGELPSLSATLPPPR